MRYTITDMLGDAWESREFEGEPKEILELLSGIEEDGRTVKHSGKIVVDGDITPELIKKMSDAMAAEPLRVFYNKRSGTE